MNHIFHTFNRIKSQADVIDFAVLVGKKYVGNCSPEIDHAYSNVVVIGESESANQAKITK